MLKKLVACKLAALALAGIAGCTMSQAQQEAYEKEQAQRAAEIAARQAPPRQQSLSTPQRWLEALWERRVPAGGGWAMVPGGVHWHMRS